MALEGHIYDEIQMTNELLRKLIAEQRNANATLQLIAAALATRAGYAEPQSAVASTSVTMSPDVERYVDGLSREFSTAIDRAGEAAGRPSGSSPTR